MELIENQQVATLIIKDTSRLGRHARLLTELMEDVFPDYDVRFISIADGIDSLYGLDDFTPFRNLFVEMHAKDCSKKQKQVRKSIAEKGERTGGAAPYGYKKSESNRKVLEIDEEVSHVVRTIFKLFAQGLGPNQVANELTKRGYLNPSNYYYNTYGVSLSSLDLTNPCKWCQKSVANMFENQVYLGHTVSLKSTTKSFKDKKQIHKPRDQWVTVKNTHPAIITQDEWDLAHQVRGGKKRKRKNFDDPNIYAGLVFCGECDASLVLHRSHTVDPRKNNFACATYKKYGKEKCTTHYISEMQLSAVILDDIKRVTHFARENEKLFAEIIARKETADTRREIVTITKEIEKSKRRCKEIDTLFQRLYEDNVLGKMPNEVFRKLSDNYLAEQKALELAIPEQEETLQKLENSISDTQRFIDKAKKYCNINNLTAEILRQFISKIVVYEKSQKYSRTADQKIEIHYRDIGYLGECVNEASSSNVIYDSVSAF